MDFVLIVLAIGGLVVAGVMLVLASRASRMQRDSDARVETLQALATGSVLFTTDMTDAFTSVPAQTEADPAFGAFPQAADVFDEFTDEAADRRRQLAADDTADMRRQLAAKEAPAAPSAPFERPSSAYPFVMTLRAGAGPAAGSFERARHGGLT